MPGLGDFWPYIIQGLAFGAMYAVTGTGLVVLYRTTGVVNLAFGAIGAMGAHVAWALPGACCGVCGADLVVRDVDRSEARSSRPTGQVVGHGRRGIVSARDHEGAL